MKFDKYELYARVAPGILTLTPIFTIWYYLRMDQEMLSFGEYIFSITFMKDLSLYTIGIYFYSHLIRVISKYYERQYFIGSDGFPTTYFINNKDKTFSRQYKERYIKKIENDFGIQIPTKDGDEKRKILSEAAKQVILRVGKGDLVFSENIVYGFFRNLIGGIVVAIPICIMNIFIAYFVLNKILLAYISVTLLLVFSLIFAFKKRILVLVAETYAKQLIAEFLRLKDTKSGG
ncbi:hypothetical protein KIAC18_000313 [Sporomusa sphaeroides]|uniref:hypothetical protein n=1 Tax=Sporomusa sphaeroides TaxID=47679 RepID=UPI003DA16092